MLCCIAAVAQNDEKEEPKRIEFYGYVVTADSLHPIRNTHVISKMAHYGTITDLQGRFRIQARQVDTLWVSCVGYTRRLITIDESLTASDTLVIRLLPETITLREVTVLPFSNYEDFKQMLVTMPSIETPDEIKRINDDLNDLWLSRAPAGNGMASQATLARNRRMYNEVLREQGRTDELLPDSLDFTVYYNMYELDEAAEKSKPKAMVPRKKYIHFGH